MKLIWLAVTLSFCHSASTQESVISSQRQRPIYLGIDNPINVFAEGLYCSSLHVKVDNGTVKKDGCFYVYRPSRVGEATFTLSKKQNGKLVNIKTHKLYVVPIPKPVAFVGDRSNGSEMTKGAFCAQPGVQASAGGNIGVDLDYDVVSFSVIIMQDSTVKFSAFQRGARFNEILHSAFLAMEPGSTILIANIWIKSPEGHLVKIDPLEYIIR